MKLEHQVCSLDPAKRLKELGVKQESLFTWRLSIDPSGTEPSEWFVSHWPGKEEELHYAAFTVAELGEMLKKANEHLPYYNGHNYECRVPAPELEDGKKYLQGDTEADARAKMLIYLLENKLITL